MVPMPDWDKGKERIGIAGYKDLDAFRRTTTDRHLWRLDGKGHWEPVRYPTVFLSAPRMVDMPYFDADAVDWIDVGVDIAGLTTLGVARYARSARVAKQAKLANEALGDGFVRRGGVPQRLEHVRTGLQIGEQLLARIIECRPGPRRARRGGRARLHAAWRICRVDGDDA